MFSIYYTSPLDSEIERKISPTQYALSIFKFKRLNLQYYTINKPIKLLDNYENLALKIGNQSHNVGNRIRFSKTSQLIQSRRRFKFCYFIFVRLKFCYFIFGRLKFCYFIFFH